MRRGEARRFLMSLTDAQLQACPLSTWDGSPDGCRWCGKKLTGRQERWCSTDCARAYTDNHAWTDVRRAAIARDGQCVRCRDEGMPLSARPTPEFRWSRVGGSLEVNHKRPFPTRGTAHCDNHLDGLETLCHWHHVQETRWQRFSTRNGRAGVRGGQRTQACWDGLHDRCWANDRSHVYAAGCTCPHHRGEVEPEQTALEVAS